MHFSPQPIVFLCLTSAVGEILRVPVASQNEIPRAGGRNEVLNGFIDKQWFGEITLGSNAQTFKVLFATGSNNLWIPCINCPQNDVPCLSHQQFDCTQSTSCVNTSATFSTPYKDGPIQGLIYKDRFCLGQQQSFCCDNVSFGCALQEPSQSLFLEPFDGILGLAPSTKQSLLLGCLLSQCPEQLFAFYLNRNPSSTTPISGEITFCGTDPNHYQGPINWVPIRGNNQWEISTEQMSVGQVQLAINLRVVIDTGTTFITGPSPYINIINAGIGAKLSDGRYLVNCDSISTMPNFTFSIGGSAYVLTPDDYILQVHKFAKNFCMSLFAPVKGFAWVFGDAFIAKYYTVFDYGKSRIGFALAKY